MKFSEKVFFKAFGNVPHTNALLGILQEIDPTSQWPGYQAYGMFGLAYAFPVVGIVIGIGVYSNSYVPATLQDEDLLVTLRSPRHPELRTHLDAKFGPFPCDEENQTQWIDHFIDFATPRMLVTAIKYALQQRMRPFLAKVAVAYDERYPNEKPSLSAQIADLPVIDYAEKFELLLWKAFTSA